MKKLKNKPFSISINRSNDSGTQKINPITVRIFDHKQIEHRFLDMCTTDGREAATAAVIFNKMDSVLVKHDIP